MCTTLGMEGLPRKASYFFFDTILIIGSSALLVLSNFNDQTKNIRQSAMSAVCYSKVMKIF